MTVVKNILLLIFLIGLKFTPVIGQIKFGPKLGISLATWGMDKDDEPANKSYLPGFTSGGVFSIPVNKSIYIQPEILYVQKGIRASILDYTESIRMNYISVPLLGKFVFGNENVKGFVNAGPFFGYALSATFVSKQDGKVQDKFNLGFDNDINDDGFANSRFEYGYSIGAGIIFESATGSLFFDIRYDQSLSSFEKYKEIPAGYTTSKNRAVLVSAGYLFNLN